MNLEKMLLQYRDITTCIILNLEKMDYNSVEELVNRRQEVINELNLLNYSKDEFKKIAKDINLLELNEKVATLINEHKVNLKSKMNSISKGNLARKSYDSNFYKNVKIFSKKV